MEGSSTRKSHGRGPPEGRRGSVPIRRVVRGPLDPLDDPLGSAATKRSRSPALSSPLPPDQAIHGPERDFSYLLQKEIYHSLSNLKFHPAFRKSPNAASPDSTLATLLSQGHLQAAAVKAAELLITPSDPPLNPSQIFQLLYTRLACLLLVEPSATAAVETKALSDLSSQFYTDPFTNTHLVPWPLRVLAVRLQGIGFSDARKAIMGYYDLGREARVEAGKATTVEQKELWKNRLRDLGIRVANALIEMGDFDGAVRHMRSLKVQHGEEEVQHAQRLGLLYLRIGNVDAAKRHLKRHSEAQDDTDILVPFISMANGKFSEAAEEWNRLRALPENKNDAMMAQNHAICLLYSCKVNEARPILESLIDEHNTFHDLLFNLSTVYELCQSDAKASKEELAKRVAAMPGKETEGWEKEYADFKLVNVKE